MPRKPVTIAAALLLTAAGATALTAGTASIIAKAEVAKLIAGHSGLGVGAIDVNPFTGRATLHDVAWTNGSVRVYAHTLDLPVQRAQWPGTKTPDTPPDSGSGIELKIPGMSGPTSAPPPAPTAAAPPPAVAAAPGTASASGVTIVDGKTTYVIKKIDLSGTSLSNADLTALLDQKSPDTLAARLAKFNASSVVVSEVTADDTTQGDESHAVLTQVLMANVANGRIGAASAAGALVIGSGAKDAGTFKTGAIQALGLDIASIMHIVNTTRTDDAEPLKSLSESLIVNDISLMVDDGTVLSVASITQKNLKARPLRTDLKALQAAAENDGDKDAQKERMKAVADDVAGSYEVSGFAIDKVAISQTKKDGTTKMGIARIALDGFRARRLAGFTIRDLALEAPGVKFGFATFDLGSVAVPPRGKAGVNPTTALATDAVPAIGKADMTQIVVDADTPQPDGTKTRVNFKLAHVGMVVDQTIGQPPTQGTLAVDNLTFDLAPTESPGAKELYTMGYRHLDLSGAVTSAYDQKAETLSIQKFLMSGVGMGSVTLGIDLGNVNKGIMSANPSIAKASALSVLLKKVDIRAANSGLIEKVVDWKAAMDGKTPAAEKDAAIDLVAVKLPEGLGNGPGIKAIGAAVAKFIADPKTLHISAASKDGLGASDLGMIGAPDELLSKLDIQAEANQ